jgi:predicted RNA methylase
MNSPTSSVAVAHDRTSPLCTAAEIFFNHLNAGAVLQPQLITAVMDDCLGREAWQWRDAYDACEAAAWLFLKHWHKPMMKRAANHGEMLVMLRKIEAMLPSQTWRSDEQNALQQFSTPLTLAWLAGIAAEIPEGSIVLEPSAGTGALAVQAEMVQGVQIQVNEIAPRRAEILGWLFGIDVSADHGAYIHARQSNRPRPDTVLMNPPFSADVNKPGKRSSDETVRHFQSAFYRLVDGGRCVVITGGTMTPSRLIKGLDDAKPRLSAVISSRAFQKQGTSIDTAIHVIDKRPSGAIDIEQNEAQSLDDLLKIIEADCPPREQVIAAPIEQAAAEDTLAVDLFGGRFDKAVASVEPIIAPTSRLKPLDYEANPAAVSSDTGVSSTGVSDTSVPDTGVFQAWHPGTIRIPQACAHPSTLSESVAMAAIKPPMPAHQPLLPTHVITDGILSEAQLETVIYAGEAHSVILPQRFTFTEDVGREIITKTDDDGFRLRQGYFLGDGTGAGKGRQVAGILLDNWHHGRRKALWLSKSDKLVEDAKRDWMAVGGKAAQVIPLSKFKQGQPIGLSSGILFATYATLRSGARNGNPSRLDQVIAWLGDDFDGCLIFDEAHALGNAAGGEKTLRGKKAPSQQGITGLALQNRLNDARVVYVSATGASSVNALAYANRLGLWSQPRFPFSDRVSFVKAMNEGGVAAAEIVARDLKALGLYTARNLSYEGVEVDILNAELTSEQQGIYDEWAGAFQVIHTNLEKALASTGIVDAEGATMNRSAKSAARSAFETTKQRFFGHLLAAMKCPILFKAIDADLEADHAVIIQIVSTAEAVMERCLERIHPSEWHDLSVDVTPRDTILDYLNKAFPVQMQSEYTDEEGNTRVEPMVDDNGRPVFDPVALAARDQLTQNLITLPPVPSALDQIIWHYGKDEVAEITGRSRRIIRHDDGRMSVERRPVSSGLTEAQAFMNGDKRILIFSEAGGTGRSYHADASVNNQGRRIHYLLEAGWRADNAIQGLGRSNRTGQVIPPVFRPISTDVKGEKRFIATIARRLDTLGAITRGQRASASQGLFREEDNLESPYARAALTQFYKDLHRGSIEAITIGQFQQITGLSLTYEGQLSDNLPPMHTFLNRLLALPIDTQNALFGELEARIMSRIELAKQAGTYELGVETITADHLTLENVEEIEGGLKLCTIETRHRLIPRTTEQLRELARISFSPKWCQNSQSNKFALAIGTNSLFNDDGTVTSRVQLIRPDRSQRISTRELEASQWEAVPEDIFAKGWGEECAELPEFRINDLTLVTGILLPVWDKLPQEAPRVRRMTTDDGTVLLGRLLMPSQLNAFRQAMGLDTIQPEPEVLFDGLLEGGAPVRLAGGLRLVNRRVYGTAKIEILGDLHEHQSQFESFGCRIEYHNYQMRVFIPNIACLKAMMAAYPVQ